MLRPDVADGVVVRVLTEEQAQGQMASNDCRQRQIRQPTLQLAKDNNRAAVERD